MALDEILSSLSKYHHLILRFGLALVFLYFGFSQLTSPSSWIGYIPSWAMALHPFSLETFVMINGTADMAFGILLGIGIFFRLFSFLACLHLLTIVIAMGFNEIGVRDFGLFMAAVALFLSQDDSYTLDHWRKNR